MTDIREPDPLLAELEEIWLSNGGIEGSSAHNDLDWMGQFFDPRRTGNSIRESVEALPEVQASPALLAVTGPGLVLPIERTCLVTPEGRLALEACRQGRPLTEHLADRRHAARDPLLDVYHAWVHGHIERIAATLRGEGEMMFPVAIAAVIVIMAYGADSRETALVLPRPLEPTAASVLMGAMDRFADRIGHRGGPRATAEIDAYPLSKAKERLGRLVHRERTRKQPASIWIDKNDQETVMGVIAAEMIERRELPPTEAVAAVDELLDLFQTGRRELGAAGLNGGDHDAVAACRTGLTKAFAATSPIRTGIAEAQVAAGEI